jgi:hypothetical protein
LRWGRYDHHPLGRDEFVFGKYASRPQIAESFKFDGRGCRRLRLASRSCSVIDRGGQRRSSDAPEQSDDQTEDQERDKELLDEPVRCGVGALT